VCRVRFKAGGIVSRNVTVQRISEAKTYRYRRTKTFKNKAIAGAFSCIFGMKLDAFDCGVPPFCRLYRYIQPLFTLSNSTVLKFRKIQPKSQQTAKHAMSGIGGFVRTRRIFVEWKPEAAAPQARASLCAHTV